MLEVISLGLILVMNLLLVGYNEFIYEVVDFKVLEMLS